MSLNPNTIKALFGKLAPYADDVARGVANYGDDVARAVTPYVDDAAGLIADNAGRAAMSPELLSDSKLDFVDALSDSPLFKRAGSSYADDVADDTARILRYMNTQSAYGSYPYHKYQSSPPIRNALSATEYYDRGIPTMVLPKDGVIKKAYDYAAGNLPESAKSRELFDLLFNATESAPIVGTNYTAPDVSALGRSAMEFDPYTGDVTSVKPLLGSVRLPSSLSADQLVIETPDFIRPHKNTALGRWFEKQRFSFTDPDAYVPFDTGKVRF